MSKMKEQAQRWIEKAGSEEELLEILVAYTKAAGATAKPAKFQLLALDKICEIAQDNGAPSGGCSLGDTIRAQQYHRIQQWGPKAFCLSERQMAVVAREEWGFLKA